MTIYFKNGTKAKATQIYLSDDHITFRGVVSDKLKGQYIRNIPLEEVKTIKVGQTLMEVYSL